MKWLDWKVMVWIKAMFYAGYWYIKGKMNWKRMEMESIWSVKEGIVEQILIFVKWTSCQRHFVVFKFHDNACHGNVFSDTLYISVSQYEMKMYKKLAPFLSGPKIS